MTFCSRRSVAIAMHTMALPMNPITQSIGRSKSAKKLNGSLVVDDEADTFVNVQLDINQKRGGRFVCLQRRRSVLAGAVDARQANGVREIYRTSLFD